MWFPAGGYAIERIAGGFHAKRSLFSRFASHRKGGGPRRRLAVELWQRWHTCHLANADDANLSLGVECGELSDLQARGSKAREDKQCNLASDSIDRRSR